MRAKQWKEVGRDVAGFTLFSVAFSGECPIRDPDPSDLVEFPATLPHLVELEHACRSAIGIAQVRPNHRQPIRFGIGQRLEQ
jgi:hypothetical protein